MRIKNLNKNLSNLKFSRDYNLLTLKFLYLSLFGLTALIMGISLPGDE